LVKHCSYFPQFDAEPADLHLVVNTTQELDVPVRQITGQVTGLIQTCSRLLAEAVGNEFLGCQLRSV
jgi:hypothetical protein